jgi:twitching motility protein PilT
MDVNLIPRQPMPIPARFHKMLVACAKTDASDLHLAPGQPPMLRQAGQLMAVASEMPLSVAELDTLVEALLAEGQTRILAARGDCDGALTVEGTRFRYNVFKRNNGVCVAFRRLGEGFRNLRELGLPESLYQLCDLPDGLVLVAGPTGAGKSTTLAALLDRINHDHSCHLITIEDPIEYVHTPVRGLVSQRQVGTDCSGFYEALVAALREDPDVIFVGEIRDLDTIRTAITAAETGHLVFTTVHAGDCAGVIERLVSVFPSGEQDGIRRQLSFVLRAVITQQLLICDGAMPAGRAGAVKRRSRVVASEILMVNSAVSNLIASAKSSQIYSAMEVGGAQGMQTLEQDLARLHVAGYISETTAVAFSKNPRTLRDRVNHLRAGLHPVPPTRP